MTQTLQTWLLAWREAFTCVGLGLRDARHAGLVSVTGLLGLGVMHGVGTLANGPSTARRYAAWQAPAGLDACAARPAWRRKPLLLLSLLIPVWAMCALIAYLLAWNVQMIYGVAAEDVPGAERQATLRREQRQAIVALGLLLCLLMRAPVLNLLLPALLCTSVCHLQRRGWRSADTSIKVE